MKAMSKDPAERYQSWLEFGKDLSEAFVSLRLVGETISDSERFNKLPPSAVRESKQLMRRSTKETLLATIQAEAEIFGARLRSPEAMEAFQAFFQKRQPDFSKF